MRKLCVVLLILCAIAAEAVWEEKNWWWDELWEEELGLLEPEEPKEADPTGKKYSLVGFDARWRQGRLDFLGSGEDGNQVYPWQLKDSFQYKKIGSKTELSLFEWWGNNSLSHELALEERKFPWRENSNYKEGEQGLVLAHQSSTWPVNVAWRVGQGNKTFSRQERYNSQSSSRGVELWGKGKGSLWQFKVQWEQLEKIFPLWAAQTYFRDSITYSGSYRPKLGWRVFLKGEAWQRQYPLGGMATSQKNQWELKLEGPLWRWQTELSYLSRLQRYPYQPSYDYFLTRGRVGLARQLAPTRQLFVGVTETAQAYFQQDKSFSERSLLLRWQEKLGQLELVIRCEVGERTDEPNPFLVQLELEQKYQ